jgi:hypothetical protein
LYKLDLSDPRLDLDKPKATGKPLSVPPGADSL